MGVISSTHGLKGEVKVYPTTDDMERFLDLETVFLDTGRGYEELTIENVKFFKNQVILKFEEFDDIDEAGQYKGRDLLIDRADAVELDENENFIGDLIGMKVIEEGGRPLGGLTEVLITGANDVYVVQGADGKEILLPAIPSCILEVDVEQGTMTVRVPEGLL